MANHHAGLRKRHASPKPVSYRVGLKKEMTQRMTNRGKRPLIRILKVFVCVLGILAVCVLAFMIYVCFVINKQTTEVTDPQKYEQILSTHWAAGQPLLAHFPEDIPENAESVTFYYLPGFLQGGMRLRLRFSLPKEEIHNLLASWEQKREMLSPPSEPCPLDIFFPPKQLGSPKEGWLLSSFEPIPDHYETFIIGGRPGDTAGFPWNHGQLYGISISLSQNQVVYWADVW